MCTMYSITYMSIDLAQRIQLESEKKTQKKEAKFIPVPIEFRVEQNTNTRQDQKAGLESRASNKKSQETVTFFYEIRNDPPPLECAPEKRNGFRQIGVEKSHKRKKKAINA